MRKNERNAKHASQHKSSLIKIENESRRAKDGPEIAERSALTFREAIERQAISKIMKKERREVRMNSVANSIASSLSR